MQLKEKKDVVKRGLDKYHSNNMVSNILLHKGFKNKIIESFKNLEQIIIMKVKPGLCMAAGA